jgi:hypothetical protein
MLILTWLHMPQQAVHVAACVVGPSGVVLGVVKLCRIHEQTTCDGLAHLQAPGGGGAQNVSNAGAAKANFTTQLIYTSKTRAAAS